MRVTRLWTPDPLGLLELWQHEGPRTLRAFSFFDDRDLAFRPQPGARSIGELQGHLVQSYSLTKHWLLHIAPPLPRLASMPGSILESVRLLRNAQAALYSLLSETPQQQFDTEIAPFGVLETRGVMAFGMLKHELHHRGELHALARVRGRSVCNVYDPVEDPPL
jgi:uncharacterized damage-inducible protein DinB